jgi:predicted permease
MSLVLLVAAGLFGRTLSNLHAIETGFNRDNVLLFSVRPGAVGYEPDAIALFLESLRERLTALPGVEHASLSSRPLPTGGGTMAVVGLDGVTPPASTGDGAEPPYAVVTTVGPSFFQTMQIPIATGRDFSPRDHASAPRVAIVNRLFVQMFGVADATGRTATLRDERYEVVGVVDDALAFTLTEERRPIVYFSYLQADRLPTSMTFEVRTAGNPMAIAGVVRDTVRQMDPRLAVHDLKTQAVHVDETISREVTLARLGSLLGALALVIACVGLYGTVAFAVARRTPEIGIRMALGARAPAIVAMVLRDVLWLAAIGLVVGLGVSAVGSRYVESLLYGIEPHDPSAIVGAMGILVGCGVAAALVPALKVTRIDPMRAVRWE